VPGDFEALIEVRLAENRKSGYGGDDFLRGLSRTRTLFGLGAYEQIEGGDGNDYLSGGNGLAYPVPVMTS